VADPSDYSCRSRIFAAERSYRIGQDALEWRVSAQRHGRLPYRDIAAVHLATYRIRGALAASVTSSWRCALYSISGRRVILRPTHHVRLGVVEYRSAVFYPFVNEVIARVTRANAKVNVVVQRHWSVRLHARFGRVVGRAAVSLIRGLQGTDPVRVADLAAGLMRRLGPFLRRHRTARANLAAAYPDKSGAELTEILRGMWDNIGRLGAEYVHLPRMWRDDVARLIEYDPAGLARFVALHRDGKPALLFGAHLANFELPGFAAAALGLDLAVLYRTPDIAALADEARQMRGEFRGTAITAGPGAADQIRQALRRGSHFAMLVDQSDLNGIAVTFFGRRCRVNPLIARLARRLDCPIHGFRAIRLPGYRFRLELTERLDLPRDTSGRIDVAAAMQQIVSIVETWVREHPEQWLWMHRFWQ
jgi:KDO2-lipid IV(A) lauroyltransferase